MNNTLARIILVSMSFSLCSARDNFSVGRLCNGLLGNFQEGLLTLINQPSGKLSPAHEELVRSVAKEINVEGIEVRASHPLRAFQGPHCMGNSLYLNDDWLEAHASTPLEQKFVIGHELVHVEKAHVLPRFVCKFGIPLLGWYLFRKLDRHYTLSEKAYELLEKYASCIPKSYREVGCDFFIYSNVVGACYNLGICLERKLSRSQEFEADAIALQRLAPLYGENEMQEAAADFFTTIEGFEPGLRHPLSTHPHSGDRLRALGLKKSVSENASSLLYSLLEKRVSLRIQCITCSEADEEQNIVMVHRFTSNWTKILRAARMCSVHQDVAQRCIGGLHAETYQALFNELLGLPSRNQIVPEATRNEYEKAIQSECETIVSYLQEKA